jgi:2-polyprenyl-3-methyl-5-hydroxy-6-metoxy-1,4-benzoquinol methylase
MCAAEKNYFHGLNTSILNSINVTHQKCLEIGCASGRLGAELKKRNNNLYYVGVDIALEALNEASDVLDEVIHCDVSKIQPGGYKKAFGFHKFDLIILGDVLEHLANPENLLLGLKEVCTPNAEVRICVPNMCHSMVIKRLLIGDFYYDDMGILDKTHLRFYSPSSIIKQLLDTGYLPQIINFHYHQMPNDYFTERLIKFSSATLGLPESYSVTNLSIMQTIVRAHISPFPSFKNQSISTGISVIVPVNDEDQFRANILESPGLKEIYSEIIPVRNSSSAADAFDRGKRDCSNDWIIFAHQDVFFPKNSGRLLMHLLAKRDIPSGPIGFIGLEYDASLAEKSSPDKCSGFVVDRAGINGLKYGLPTKKAVSIDECAVILNRNSQVRLDPDLGWHLWATDLCIQDWDLNGKPSTEIIQVPIFHNSTLKSIPDEWQTSAKKLAAKWTNKMPYMTLCGLVN